MVAAAILAAARNNRSNFSTRWKFSKRFRLPTVLSAGRDARLYGRQDARRYFRRCQAHFRFADTP